MPLPYFTNRQAAQYNDFEPSFKSIVLAEHYGVDEEVIEYYKANHSICIFYPNDHVYYDTFKSNLIGISRILKIQNIKDKHR